MSRSNHALSKLEGKTKKGTLHNGASLFISATDQAGVFIFYLLSFAGRCFSAVDRGDRLLLLRRGSGRFGHQ